MILSLRIGVSTSCPITFYKPRLKVSKPLGAANLTIGFDVNEGIVLVPVYDVRHGKIYCFCVIHETRRLKHFEIENVLVVLEPLPL